MAGKHGNWDELYLTAEGQQGHFTLAQARAAGYDGRALRTFVERGWIVVVRPGVYRLTGFRDDPPGPGR